MNTICRKTAGTDEKGTVLTLATAPDANHRKQGASDEKPVPALLPVQAQHWLDSVRQSGRIVSGIHFCGPGDALTSWSATAACLDSLHKESIPFSLTCLGLEGAAHTPDLKRYGIKQVTLLVDSLRQETCEQLYSWIRPARKTTPLKEGIALLLRNQPQAVESMAAAGIKVIIQTTVQTGINNTEIAEIAQKMAQSGATEMEIIGNSSFAEAARPFLKSKTITPDIGLASSCKTASQNKQHLPSPASERPNLAVASSNGMDVNLHLGQAGRFLIYGPRGEDGLACLLETRMAPADNHDNRWQALADTLPDCFAVLASHAGDAPRKQLSHRGIEVLLLEEQIEGVVDTLYGGGKKRKCKQH